MILLCKKISLIIMLLINITRNSSHVICDSHSNFTKSINETYFNLISKPEHPGTYLLQYSEKSSHNCTVNKVNILIYILEDVNREQCHNLISSITTCHTSDKLSSCNRKCHTWDYFNLTLQTCDVVNLEYAVYRMFQGCYQIFVQVFYEDDKTKKPCVIPQDHYYWVENNLTNDSVQYPKPIISAEHMREYSKVLVDFRIPTTNATFYWKVGETDDFMNVSGNCTEFDSTKVQCLLSLQTGLNFFHFSFDNPHCRCLSSVFTTPCMRTNKLAKPKIDEQNSKPVMVTGFDRLSPILIGITCVMALVVCYILFIYRKRRNWKREKLHRTWLRSISQSDNVTKDNINELNVRGIFLLYARDCEPFMDAMLQLQKYLFKATGLPVYNLFDSNQFTSISRSPYEWVERHIHDPKVRVVLVATRCSQLMYIELLERIAQPLSDDMRNMSCLLYKRPHSMDCLIQHAIKLLSGAVSFASPYKKNFVCQLLNFPNEDLLLQINPYKRYILPGLLSSLLDDIECMQSTNDIVDIEKMFIASLNHLSTYVNSHPGYLSDLLKKTS